MDTQNEKFNKMNYFCNHISIIEEAANRLPDEYKDTHPEIDWFRIRGFRNRVVHDYLGIDYSIVWQIKEKYLPQLIKTMMNLSSLKS